MKVSLTKYAMVATSLSEIVEQAFPPKRLKRDGKIFLEKVLGIPTNATSL